MFPIPTTRPLPELPRPGQQVRWRNPRQAQAWGWQALFGAGPFEVVYTVDHTDQGLAAGVVLRTDLGEREVSEVWLEPAGEPGGDTGSRQAGAAG
jgi:hypothetical protein